MTSTTGGTGTTLSRSYISYRRLLGLSFFLAYLLQNSFRLLTWMAGFIPSWIMGWIRWKPTSPEDLQMAEEKLFTYMGTPFEASFVNIGKGSWAKDQHIRSLTFNPGASEREGTVPLVLLHGLGAGVGLWVLNVEALTRKRTVYAFDILGFGRSSRPKFSSGAMEAEYQLVQSIEEWRERTNLDRFILCGHSMGGFLGMSYALQHPSRVAHLILADPWGFPELDKREDSPRKTEMPFWVKGVVAILKPFNPFMALRLFGPLGPGLIDYMRPDLMKKFTPVIDNPSLISSYIYHCNAQEPSGEAAFKSMAGHLGWARHPMLSRINDLRNDIPMTFIYGSRSWVDRDPGIETKFRRPDSYVDIQIIVGSGHHVYADRYEQFNTIVDAACKVSDSTDVTFPTNQSQGQQEVAEESKSS